VRGPRVIGIAGGSGSGKSAFARTLLEALSPHAVLISQDWYYRDRSDLPYDQHDTLNFDHPSAFNSTLLQKQLAQLRAGNPVQTPRYDYVKHVVTREVVEVRPAPIILLEGILILHSQALRKTMDVSVFIHVPADIRLMRRIRRDAIDRGIPVEETLRLYELFARPMHERYIEPSARHATHVWHQEKDSRFPAKFLRKLAKWTPTVEEEVY
jgi:uridine kinase